jgi:hypothetical protein
MSLLLGVLSHPALSPSPIWTLSPALRAHQPLPAQALLRSTMVPGPQQAQHSQRVCSEGRGNLLNYVLRKSQKPLPLPNKVSLAMRMSLL